MKCRASLVNLPMDAACPECGHAVGSHLWPACVCMECVVDFLEGASIAAPYTPQRIPDDAYAEHNRSEKP